MSDVSGNLQAARRNSDKRHCDQVYSTTRQAFTPEACVANSGRMRWSLGLRRRTTFFCRRCCRTAAYRPPSLRSRWPLSISAAFPPATTRLPRRALLTICMAASRRDRKSVVQGKSVSVRVDLGGRRIIKKKIHCAKNELTLKVDRTSTENIKDN